MPSPVVLAARPGRRGALALRTREALGRVAPLTRSLATAFVVASVIAGTAVGQTTTGSIRGHVRGPNAAPIAEAQVSLLNAEMGVTRGASTNTSGYYFIGGLRPGRYELSVRRLGFTPVTRTVDIGIAVATTVDLQIQEAATQLTAVAVTAEAAQTTQTSEVGSNVTKEQIDNLPNFERNFLDIARLVPGVTAKAVNDQNKFLAAGGQPAEAVNVFVDGATYKNDVLRGGVVGQDASKGNPFPQAAVQEFRVITQNYKAEYQKASSAIITATTRSGTNRWEADVFGYAIGKAYTARDPIVIRNGGPRPNYQRLQAGGSVGGPIARDKLFFFGTYEANFRDQPQNVVLGGSAPDAPPSLNPEQYAGTFTSEFRGHLGFGKLTWIASERNTVDASINIRHETDFRGFGGQTSYEAAENLKVNVNTGVVNWRYAGDRWLNEAQVNLQTFTWNPTPRNAGLIQKQYVDIVTIGGREGGQKFDQTRLSLRNDLTRSGIQLGGEHVFKMGGSVDFLSYDGEKNFFFNEPRYRFRRNENWLTPFEAIFSFGDPKISTDNTQVGFYLQDDWTPTRRLVINLGLRWDFETNMINNSYVTPQALADSLRGPLNPLLQVPQPQPSGPPVNVRVIDELGGLDRYITTGKDDRPIYYGAIQPRVGLSYDLSGKSSTVLFGGFGIYYDRNYWNTLFDEQFRRQYRQGLRVCFQPQTGCIAVVPWNDRYFDPVQLRTLSYATAPEVFMVANDLKPPKTYQYSAGVRQELWSGLVTLSYNGVRGYNGMNFVRGAGNLPPNYSAVFVTDDRVKTWYDAMQLAYERPLRDQLRFGGSLAYTLALTKEQGQSADIFWGFNARYPTVADLPKRRAPGDQRHNIVANGIARLPWEVLFSTVVSLGTGIAVNATDASEGFGAYQQVPYVYQPPTRPFLGIGHVFNYQNMDLRLEKWFTFTQGQRVSLSADLFNVFNSRNYGCYNTTINPSSGPPNANYGVPGCAALGRRFQIGLRYGFSSLVPGSVPGND